MRKRASLQRHLSLGLAIGVSVMWIAATAAAALIVRAELDEVFDSAMQETAQRILPLAVIDIISQGEERPPQRILTIRKHDEHLNYVVRDEKGNVLMRSHDAELAIFPPFEKTGFATTETHRLYSEAAVRGTVTITIAEPLGDRRKATLDAAMALALPLGALIPASFVGVWWLVRRSMRPVHVFGDQIERRGSGDLTPVDTASLPREITPIADGVNRLMERLRRALEAERTFTANSAHELRTPIAAALAQTQRLVAEAPRGPLQDRARDIEGALHSLARLGEKLMQLAKAEGGGLIAAKPHNLVPILSLVANDFTRTAATADRLDLSLPKEPVMSRMDADVFAILARNLIENGLKHAPAGTRVAVSLTSERVFSVSNAGSSVAPEVLKTLTRRFARGETSTDGTGLGLAIAESISAGAGARLELLSPASGREDGFEARVYLDAGQA
ncbi:ATP-binding protein [Ciceribacter thiooxidans]|uniref:histidine kinase n=1 Tax=Ciceribacter thiooxidans TaxID=1969821 RepID=A0ABV7I848_9HYPH|nr:ATP-binding protein [Ciceribacter thiooxidans]